LDFGWVVTHKKPTKDCYAPQEPVYNYLSATTTHLKDNSSFTKWWKNKSDGKQRKSKWGKREEK